MGEPLHILKPEYGGRIMAIVLLLILGSPITWAVHPFLSIFFVLVISILGYTWFKKSATTEFHEEYMIYKSNFGKLVEWVEYDNLSWMKYERRGNSSSFIIYFKQPIPRPIFHIKSVSSDSESLPEIKRLVAFLKTKNVILRVKPIKLKKLFEVSQS